MIVTVVATCCFVVDLFGTISQMVASGTGGCRMGGFLRNIPEHLSWCWQGRFHWWGEWTQKSGQQCGLFVIEVFLICCCFFSWRKVEKGKQKGDNIDWGTLSSTERTCCAFLKKQEMLPVGGVGNRGAEESERFNTHGGTIDYKSGAVHPIPADTPSNLSHSSRYSYQSCTLLQIPLTSPVSSNRYTWGISSTPTDPLTISTHIWNERLCAYLQICFANPAYSHGYSNQSRPLMQILCS